MKSSATAYWLIPAEPARAFFARMIGGLAARFDAPVFDPHLTLFVAPENALSPAELVRDIGTVRIALAPTGIHCSERFTKTLFVQFEKSEPLQELADSIWKLSGAAQCYVVDPHVSLLYNHLPEQTKVELARSLQLPFREIMFDSVRAVRCASPIQTTDDVRAWQLLASQISNTR